MTMVRRTGTWLTVPMGDDLLMMSPEQENYVNLNEVGAWIWGLLETPRHLDEICGLLIEEFEVEPAEARATTETFLARLKSLEAVALVPA